MPVDERAGGEGQQQPGRYVAADTTDTSRGSRVTVTASNGTAAANAPSPTALMPVAHHNRQ
ncbi:hypothetical protein ACFQX6_06665 [Streptosporangium lutulentum]